MNKYEDPTQRLTSHNWSEEYKENYEKIFGKKETWLERRIREEKAQALKEEFARIDAAFPISAVSLGQHTVCSVCKIDWRGVMGYVCPNQNCPMQMKVSC